MQGKLVCVSPNNSSPELALIGNDCPAHCRLMDFNTKDYTFDKETGKLAFTNTNYFKVCIEGNNCITVTDT